MGKKKDASRTMYTVDRVYRNHDRVPAMFYDSSDKMRISLTDDRELAEKRCSELNKMLGERHPIHRYGIVRYEISFHEMKDEPEAQPDN